MAGKSTFLRQNALLALLAQMGSFVPATRAHMGVVDRLFSRVGAADDLARGRSTFMVEMVETAAILNQATPRSLVILDEIGRGTATFDGLSIAWACVEALHEVNRSRALFATHFHELATLAETLPRLVQPHDEGQGMEGQPRLPARGRAGAADRSYGIQVAKLAGLPPTVIKRARRCSSSWRRGRATPLERCRFLLRAAAARPEPIRCARPWRRSTPTRCRRARPSLPFTSSSARQDPSPSGRGETRGPDRLHG